MDDREMLELAAKAAGYVIQPNWSHHWCLRINDEDWNSLNDDGDCFRLETDLKLRVVFWENSVAVFIPCYDPCYDPYSPWFELPINEGDDPRAVRRRASTRVAAMIGKSMK